MSAARRYLSRSLRLRFGGRNARPISKCIHFRRRHVSVRISLPRGSTRGGLLLFYRFQGRVALGAFYPNELLHCNPTRGLRGLFHALSGNNLIITCRPIAASKEFIHGAPQGNGTIAVMSLHRLYDSGKASLYNELRRGNDVARAHRGAITTSRVVLIQVHPNGRFNRRSTLYRRISNYFPISVQVSTIRSIDGSDGNERVVYRDNPVNVSVCPMDRSTCCRRVKAGGNRVTRRINARLLTMVNNATYACRVSSVRTIRVNISFGRGCGQHVLAFTRTKEMDLVLRHRTKGAVLLCGLRLLLNARGNDKAVGDHRCPQVRAKRSFKRLLPPARCFNDATRALCWALYPSVSCAKTGYRDCTTGPFIAIRSAASCASSRKLEWKTGEQSGDSLSLGHPFAARAISAVPLERALPSRTQGVS